MVRSFALFIALTVTLISANAFSKIMFEGYYKIVSGGVHSGFMIQRYEFEEKTKQFIFKKYLKTSEFGGAFTEVVRARCGDNMAPISYQYHSEKGKKITHIDSTMKGQKMTGTMLSEDGATKKINETLPKGTLISSFLGLLLVSNKQGIKTQTGYDYKAISEEDAKVFEGKATVESLEEFRGVKAYKVSDQFKGTKFISYMTDTAEVLSVKSPLLSVGAELVTDSQEAIGKFSMNEADVKKLFGGIPAGKTNVLAKMEKTPSTPQEEQVPGKKFGVPGGKGIMIKGQSPTSQEPSPTENK